MNGKKQPLTILPSLSAVTLLAALHIARSDSSLLVLGSPPDAPLRLLREYGGGDSDGDAPLMLARPRALAALHYALQSLTEGGLDEKDGRGTPLLVTLPLLPTKDSTTGVVLTWEADQQQQQQQQQLRWNVTVKQATDSHAMLWLPVLAPFLRPIPLESYTADSTVGSSRTYLSDGHGRLFILIHEMLSGLRQAAESGGALCALSACVFPQGLRVTRRVLSASPEDREFRRLLLLLRRLSREGGFTVPMDDYSAITAPALTEGSPPLLADWLQVVAARVRVALTARGDFFPFTPASMGTSPRSPTLRALAGGAVHYVLSTEVTGAALTTIRDLLLAYLFAPLFHSLPCECDEERVTSVALMVDRLEWLCRCPHLAVQLAPPCFSLQRFSVGGGRTPFATAARAAAATGPCPAPISYSQLLPPHLVLLSREEDIDDGCDGSAAARAARQEWCALSSTLQLPATSTSELEHLRVLLLRIDPEGDWLSPEENAFNTQTFFSFYENDINTSQQQKRHQQHQQRRCDADGDSSDEDREDSMKVAGCVRFVFPHESSSQQSQHISSLHATTPSSTVAADTEDDATIVKQILAAAALSHEETATAADIRILRASLQLFLFAAKHRVDVILTPEMSPPLLRSFGARYLPVLRALLAARGVGGRNVTNAADRIPLIDRLRLQDFVALQARLGVSAAERTPLLLCRDSLRIPTHAVGATAGKASTGHESNRSHNSAAVAARSGGECPAIFSATHIVHSLAANLLRTRLEKAFPAVFHDSESGEKGGGAAVEGLVPPPGSRLGGRTLCLVALPRSVHSHPTILLVSPTPELSEKHTALLLKAATALHTALTVDHGVVRGGGAALMAVARELRTLKTTVAESGSCSASSSSPSLAPHNAPVMSSMARSVLSLLADACLAVPTALAETVIHTNPTYGKHPVHKEEKSLHCCEHGDDTTAFTRGPRGRRRLWGLAVLAAMSAAPGCACWPELHVCSRSTKSVARARLAAMDSATRSASTPTRFDADRANSGDGLKGMGVYGDALRVFAPDLTSPDDGGFPLVECLTDNVSVLRVAAHALYLILTATLKSADEAAPPRL